jgi:hypothetical protein
MAKRNLSEAQWVAAEVLQGALSGDKRDQNRLVEGISTSDYPTLLAPALNQILLNEYEAQPVIWDQIASRETVDDFRPEEYLTADWDKTDPDIEAKTAGETHFPGALPRVPEYGEYSRIRFSASGQNLQTKKNGVALQISWEAIVNDRRFSLLRRVPGEFGRRAKEQEDVEIVRLLTDTALWTGDFLWSAATATAGLTLGHLEAAFQRIADTGYGYLAPSYKLVVPNALELTARNILSITQVTEVQGAGTANEIRLDRGNPVAGKISGIVATDKYTALGGASDDWFLIPDVGSKPNPALANVFLAGHESPEVFVKRTTFSAPEDGAFENDDWESKVRHVVAGASIDLRGALKVTPT